MTPAQIEAERAADRIRNMAHLSDAELTRRALAEDGQGASAYHGNHFSAAPTNMYRDELRRRQAVAAQDAGAVKVSAKLFHAGDWVSMRNDCFRPIETAAQMLARWTEVYGRPEAIDTDTGSKFWLRDEHGYNALVVITGAKVADLRNAYRSRQLVAA